MTLSDLNSLDYLLEIPEAFPSQFCKDLVTSRKNSKLEPFEDIVCWRGKNLYKEWHHLFDVVDNYAYPHISKYLSQFFNSYSYSDIHLEGIGISRQRSNDYDRLHYDTNIVNDNNNLKIRPFVFLVYLNGDFEGGQLVFPSQKRVIEPKEGKVIIFPCSYMFPHRVCSIAKGDRFSLRLNYYFNKADIDSNLDYWDNSKLGVQDIK